MKIQRMILATVGFVLFFASALFGQEVKTDCDRNVDFSKFRTYSWERVQTQDPLWIDRIKGAVNAALTAKGWSEVASGGDVSIIAMEMAKNHQTLNTYYDGFGGGWRWGGGFGDETTTVDTYRVGTLVVDLFNTNTKQLIWRGSSSDTISNNSGKNINNLDRGVKKMFDHFPPATKKS